MQNAMAAIKAVFQFHGEYVKLFSVYIAFILVVFCVAPIHAQHHPPKHMQGDIVTIHSKILREARKIYIHVPAPDTTQKNKRFPVLYLMDGESHFDMLSQYIDYLSRWDVNVMPAMIVVGIVNTKRTRDLTPTESIINYFGKPDTSKVSWMKPSGGNALFLQFISGELMPYIEGHYKTDSYKILAGHSFGGIACINCLLTHPGIFNAYIAISPSIWWDNASILQLADKKWLPRMVLNKTFFYSDASEGSSDSSSFHTNLLKLDSLIGSKAMSGFNHQYKYYPTETHMTEPLPAYYDALRFIYKDWKPASK